jgi:hypothetical protein
MRRGGKPPLDEDESGAVVLSSVPFIIRAVPSQFWYPRDLNKLDSNRVNDRYY